MRISKALEHLQTPLYKKAEYDGSVVSYVPREQLDSIKKDGLLGMRAILQRPGMLERIAKSRGMDPVKWRGFIDEAINEGRSHHLDGPNVMFKGPSDKTKLLDNHPLKTMDLTPVGIDLRRILEDMPDTRVHGMELMPYSSYKKLPKKEQTFEKRHRDLNTEELRSLMSRSGEDLWSTYNDIAKRGLYAPDVPHAAVITPDGTISPKYLSFLADEQKEASFIEPFMGIGTKLFGALRGVGQKAYTAGSKVFKPAAERFQAGRQHGLDKYLGKFDPAKQIEAGRSADALLKPTEAGKFFSEMAGGIGHAIGGSVPGKAFNALTSRNSNLWRGGFGSVVGRDPLTGAFNIYAGLEGARKGKEVGGWSGAIAGGVGGLAASRAAFQINDLARRGILRDIQHGMLAGKMTGLQPGALRGAVANIFQRGATGAEKMLGAGATGKITNNKFFSGLVNKLRSPRTTGSTVTVQTAKGPKDLVMGKSFSEQGMVDGMLGAGASLPKVHGAIPLALGIGGGIAAVGAADAGSTAAFNAYKRFADANYQSQQKRIAQENYLRRISPEFRSTGHNPYANQAGA